MGGPVKSSGFEKVGQWVGGLGEVDTLKDKAKEQAPRLKSGEPLEQVKAIASMWQGIKEGIGAIAMPKLTSGIRLARDGFGAVQTARAQDEFLRQADNVPKNIPLDQQIQKRQDLLRQAESLGPKWGLQAKGVVVNALDLLPSPVPVGTSVDLIVKYGPTVVRHLPPPGDPNGFPG